MGRFPNAKGQLVERCPRLLHGAPFPGVPSLVVSPTECFGPFQSISHLLPMATGVRTLLRHGWSGDMDGLGTRVLTARKSTRRGFMADGFDERVGDAGLDTGVAF
jgi:hypothetical protein